MMILRLCHCVPVFEDLLFRLCGLRLRFGAERFVRVCCTDTGARRQTAGLMGN